MEKIKIRNARKLRGKQFQKKLSKNKIIKSNYPGKNATKQSVKKNPVNEQMY